MRSLRGDGGEIDGRDARPARALRMACGGALLATSGFAGVTLLRPDLVSLAAPAVGPASLVIGLAGLATLGVVATSKRARSGSPATEGETTVTDAAPARETGEGRMRANVNELGEAVVAARIARVLFVVPPGETARQAVALARRLAQRGEPAILVDFGGGSTVGELGLFQAAENVAYIAASPATFAHSIHRDRSTRLHVMAAHLDPPTAEPDAAADAVSVLATLEEVYARVVAIVPADRPELISALVHEDTALAVPGEAANPAGLDPALDGLLARGAGEVIVVTDEARERPKTVPPRTVARHAAHA